MAMNVRLLRPRDSLHPEAADWRNRVIANGGTASAGTLNAVSRFCRDIDAAGLRDRFYRLNLLCGTSDPLLVAVRTPLYVATSFGGATVGDAIDSNSSFVEGDYAETGASGGLKGNGSNKRLGTGVTFSAAPVATISLSAYAAEMETTGGANTNNALMGSLAAAGSFHGAALSSWWNFGTPNGRRFDVIGGSGSASPMQSSALPSGAFVSASNTSGTTFALFQNGVETASATASVGTATNNASGQILVFCRNNLATGTGATVFTAARIRAYHIGLTMTAAQHLSLYNAIHAFQTRLGRQV